MKKILFVFLFLPLLSFASFDYNGYRIYQWMLFNYTDFDTVPRRLASDAVSPSSIDDVRAFYYNHTFSFKFKDRTSVVNSLNIVLPSSDIVQSSSSYLSISNGVYCVSNSVPFLLSPLYFNEIRPFYFGAASLFVSGYNGPGMTVFSSGNLHCINVNLVELIPNVLSSTNSVFRQILLSSISSISDSLSGASSSLASIDRNVSFSSSLLSGISSNFFSVSSNVSDLLSASRSNSDLLSSIDTSVFRLVPPSPDDLHSSLSVVQDEGSLFGFNFSNSVFELDPSHWDSSPSGRVVYDFWADAICRGVPLVTAFVKGFEAYQPFGPSGSSGFYALGKQFNSSLSSDLAVIQSSVNAAQSSLEDVHSSLVDVHSSVAAVVGAVDHSNTNLAAIGRSLSFSADNPFVSMFSGDLSSFIKSLSESHTDPNDPFNPSNPNSIYNPSNPNSVFNPDNPNYIGNGGAFGGFVTNNVTRPLNITISNSVQKAQIAITTNATENSELEREIMNKILKLLEDLTSPGTPSSDHSVASVRIVDPVNGGRVLVDTGLERFDPDAFDWKTLLDGISVYAKIPDFTNSVIDYTSYLEQLISNTAPYKLWLEYEQNVIDGSFSSVAHNSLSPGFLESFGSDFETDVLDDNFWLYFTAVSGRQASDIHFIASLFTNVSSVIEFANSTNWGSDEDGNEKNMFSVAKEVISSFPSKTAIEDYISQATNAGFLVSSSTNLLSSVLSTNDASKIIDDFFVGRGSSLPSDFVLLKLVTPDNDVKVFDIPINDQAALWSTLRASITVVFTLVNLLLLPKFVLIVIRLFMRLFRRSLPFIDTDK